MSSRKRTYNYVPYNRYRHSHSASEYTRPFHSPSSSSSYRNIKHIKTKKHEHYEPSRTVMPLNTSERSNEKVTSEKESTDRKNTEEPQTPLAMPKFQSIISCRTIDNFEFVVKVGNGTYGIVSKVKDKTTGEFYAMKLIKQDNEKDGFPLSALREIKTLMLCNHQNIVKLEEIVVNRDSTSVYLIMEYLEHDLQTLMELRDHLWTIAETKCLIMQLLRGVAYLHKHWILHRDIKPANLLMNNMGILKLGDFGLAREYGSPPRAMTPGVVTLWYRAPEVILAGQYTQAIDMWSCGCILAELLSNKVLFQGTNDLDQINKIYQLLGTPNDQIWPGYSNLKRVKEYKFLSNPYSKLRSTFPQLTEHGYDLLKRMLLFDPKKRITASEALQHAYFKEVPAPTDPSFMPTHKSRVDGKVTKLGEYNYPSYQEVDALNGVEPPLDEHGSFVFNVKDTKEL